MENRLTWFENVKRKPTKYVVRRVNRLKDSYITRSRGILEKLYDKLVEKI